MDELRKLVDLQGRAAVVLALPALLLRPLAELVAGEKLKVFVGEPDVLALAQLRRVPVPAAWARMVFAPLPFFEASSAARPVSLSVMRNPFLGTSLG